MGKGLIPSEKTIREVQQFLGWLGGRKGGGKCSARKRAAILRNGAKTRFQAKWRQAFAEKTGIYAPKTTWSLPAFEASSEASRQSAPAINAPSPTTVKGRNLSPNDDATVYTKGDTRPASVKVTKVVPTAPVTALGGERLPDE